MITERASGGIPAEPDERANVRNRASQRPIDASANQIQLLALDFFQIAAEASAVVQSDAERCWHVLVARFDDDAIHIGCIDARLFRFAFDNKLLLVGCIRGHVTVEDLAIFFVDTWFVGGYLLRRASVPAADRKLLKADVRAAARQP